MIQQLLNVTSILWFVAVILTIILFFVARSISKQNRSPHPVGWAMLLTLSTLCTLYFLIFYYMEWSENAPFLATIQEWIFIALAILMIYFWKKCYKSIDYPLS